MVCSWQEIVSKMSDAHSHRREPAFLGRGAWAINHVQAHDNDARIARIAARRAWDFFSKTDAGECLLHGLYFSS